MLRGGAQRLRILFRFRPSVAHACDDHLLKLLELPVQEAVNTHLFKVVTDDAAHICRQAVIGDNVDQEPTHHKEGDALNQKPLFVSAPSSILRQDRQIRRIQENGMKSAWADIGAEEAAEADAVQLLLCLFRPVVIQFNAVALAVRPKGEPKQGVSCSTAWVDQVGRVPCGKDNAVGDIPHMREVRGVMPQPDIVHQAPDD